MFDFLIMIHRPKTKKDSDQSRLNVAEEVLEQLQEVPRIEGLLESAFPVSEIWMAGELDKKNVNRPDIDGLESYLGILWKKLKAELKVKENGLARDSKRRYVGEVGISNKRILRKGAEVTGKQIRTQSFELALRSQVFGGEALLRCVSPVGEIDLYDQSNLDTLYVLQQETKMSKVCAIYNPKLRKHLVTVEGDRLFHLKTTQWQEIEDLVVRTVEAADQIESELLGHDDDARFINKRRGGEA